MSNKAIFELDQELKEWSKSIAFYEDELKILEGRLQEVVSKNTGETIRASIEHYQNQYILQKEHFDHLLHDIRKQKEAVDRNVQQGDRSVKPEVQEKQTLLRDRVQTAGKIFTETKQQFYRFAADVL
jgi:gas vesicle protein